MLEDHYGRQVGAHRKIRLRLRGEDGPQEGHRRPQGEHYEAWRRPVLAKLRGGNQV